MKVIILSIANYKEKDGIITAISEDESLSFLVRGLFDPKSKNAALNNPTTVVDIELVKKNGKYPNLESYSLVSSPYLLRSDLKRLSAIQVLLEATLKLVIEEERFYLYQDLNDALSALKVGVDPNSVVLMYLARVLKVNGYVFSINKCTVCGTKNDIVAFSFYDGGFLCKEHLGEAKADLSIEQMLLLRNVFGSSIYSSIEKMNEENAAALLMKFDEYIKDSFGVNMKSFDLFLK